MQNLLGAAKPAPAPEPEPTGWYSDLVKMYKEGKFKTYARWGGVGNTILLVAGTIILGGTLSIGGIVAIFLGILIGILELPFCCTCFQWCQIVQKWFAVFEIYWLRGLLYIIIGLSLGITFSQTSNILCLIYSITCILDGLCYVVAHIRGETHTAADNTASGLGVNTAQLKKQAVVSAMGIV